MQKINIAVKEGGSLECPVSCNIGSWNDPQPEQPNPLLILWLSLSQFELTYIALEWENCPDTGFCYQALLCSFLDHGFTPRSSLASMLGRIHYIFGVTNVSNPAQCHPGAI